MKKIPCAVFELKAYKAVLRSSLAGHTVAMVSYCAMKMITCSPMTGQFFDTMFVALSDKEWLIL